MTEYLDIIDENDNVLRAASKEEVYRKRLSHRIVHVFVIHPDTKGIYLQIRGPDKGYLPNHYCVSAGGHVQSGESYEEAAKRELKEELGITAPLTHVATFPYLHIDIPIFMALYTCEADTVHIDGDEVSGGKFVSVKEAEAMIRKGILIHPQLAACFAKLVANQDRT